MQIFHETPSWSWKFYKIYQLYKKDLVNELSRVNLVSMCSYDKGA